MGLLTTTIENVIVDLKFIDEAELDFLLINSPQKFFKGWNLYPLLDPIKNPA